MSTISNIDHENVGSSTLEFKGKYISISRLNYALVISNGERYEGKTSDYGAGGSLVLGGAKSLALPAPIWFINSNESIVEVIIEVARDDGSWKEIGKFKLERGKHKQITAEITTIKMPFKLGYVGQNSNN